VDPVLIEQVLLNLLDNALKFSPPGSPLAIRGWVSDAQAQLMVSDQGPGFCDGEEARVFDKLYRGSRSGLASGAGLGLAICKGIALAHGGSIRACTPSQGGAQIVLSLPIEGVPPALSLERAP
jgi:two-component system sensor histidine kinase KdpD